MIIHRLVNKEVAMRSVVYSLLAFALFSYNSTFAQYPDTESASGKVLVIREGKEIQKKTVVVEAYLKGDILEVEVGARILRERPKIHNLLLVGPGIGRVHYTTSEIVPPSTEEEAPYPITRSGGLVSFGEKTEVKYPKGALSKRRFDIEVPVDKLVAGGKYELWVDLRSKTRGGSRGKKFEFLLENFYELVSSEKK